MYLSKTNSKLVIPIKKIKKVLVIISTIAKILVKIFKK